jgi:hypothetical protein
LPRCRINGVPNLAAFCGRSARTSAYLGGDAVKDYQTWQPSTLEELGLRGKWQPLHAALTRSATAWCSQQREYLRRIIGPDYA